MTDHNDPDIDGLEAITRWAFGLAHQFDKEIQWDTVGPAAQRHWRDAVEQELKEAGYRIATEVRNETISECVEVCTSVEDRAGTGAMECRMLLRGMLEKVPTIPTPPPNLCPDCGGFLRYVQHPMKPPGVPMMTLCDCEWTSTTKGGVTVVTKVPPGGTVKIEDT
jgi:hypothetical protein